MHPLLLLLLAAPAFAAGPEPRVLTRLGDDRFRQVHDAPALVYSPDGKLLASIDGATIILWDARDGRRVRTISIPEGESGRALRFGADGQTLTVVAQARSHQRCSRLDVATGAVLNRLSFEVQGNTAVFSPTGRYLVTRLAKAADPTILDLDTGRPVLPSGWTGAGDCLDVVFRPDEKAVAVLKGFGEVRLIDLATGAEIARPTIEGNARRVVFTPDGRDLVATRAEGGGLVRFDAVTGKVKWTAKVSVFEDFAVAPGGHTLIYLGMDYGTRYSWRHLDIATGRPVAGSAHTGPTTAYVVHPAGHIIATAYDGHISQWDFKAGGRLAASADPPVPVTDLYFKPDGRAARGWADAWYEWDLTTGKQTRLSPRPVGGFWDQDVESRDLRWRARRRPVLFNDEDESTGRWGFEIESTATGSWRSILPGGEANGWDYQFLPNGRLLTTDSDIWTVVDPATGHTLLRVPLDGDGMGAVTDDGRQLAALTPTATGYRLSRWDTATGRLLGAWAGRPSLSVDDRRLTSLWLAPDGRTAVAWFTGVVDGPDEHLALAFDTEAGTERGQWKCSSDDRLTFLPDGRSAIVWSPHGRELAIRELVTGDLRQSLAAPGPVAGIRSRPDGRALLVATRPYPVELWSLPADRGSWSPARADTCWTMLGDPDSAAAYPTILALRDHPVEAVELFKSRTVIARPVGADWLNLRIARLDARAYRDREQASADLAATGEQATPALRRGLPGASAEARERILKILAADTGRTSEQLRAIRACEVLEAIGTPEARALLVAWAKGAPDTTLVREANASVRRLTPVPARD
ncbi:MAG TPA: WD40 repeat domain-containing protein [Gemmataceae bacterium]|nr:WD40 repeat domain-containing protein [Gemmataceae bacterium]